MADHALLIPVKRWRRRSGVFRWAEACRFCAAERDDLQPLSTLARDAEAAYGLAGIRVARGAPANADRGPAAVSTVRDAAVQHPEGYVVTVGPRGIVIRSATAAGAYYGVQTLRELLRVRDREWDACRIEDHPDFARRGVYLDCSRGKVPTLRTLKQLVEQLAAWKLNELQLYIENVFTFRRHPDIGRGDSPLTPEDILALQAHGEQHHVRLVPSLASLGHMERVLALPAYRKLGELPGHRGWPGGTTLCPVDPGSIRLLRDLYAEFLPLFKATDFNVCGDEPWELGRGRSRARCEAVGKGRVYLGFMLQLHKLCERHGKRMNAWSDIALEHPELLTEWPKDVVMLNWEYEPAGRRIARSRAIVDAGPALVVCPGTNAWRSHGCRLRKGMANIADFAAEGLACSAEGLLNTDWGDFGHRNPLAVSLHNLAWGAAHAWNHAAAGARPYAERFARRFCLHALARPSARPRRVRETEARRLAEAVVTLGSTGEALKMPGGGMFVYDMLRPFHRPRNGPRSCAQPELDAAAAADIRARIAALSALKWPSMSAREDEFLSATFEEFRLAALQDIAALRRALLEKSLREFRIPMRADAERAVEAVAELIPEMNRVWRLRNRPSRLRDNLADLRAVLAECRQVAQGAVAAAAGAGGARTRGPRSGRRAKRARR